jgi:hypothetical protein
MLTYLWLEMNLLMLIMSNLFLQVSSQPAICLFFSFIMRSRWSGSHSLPRRPGPATSSQPGPAAPRTDGQQPARTGGKAASQVRRSGPATMQPRAAPRHANQQDVHRTEENQYKGKNIYLVLRYKGNN